MKNKDLFRLAATSLKGNRRAVANTVRGIAFGGILLVIVVYVIAAFYGGIMIEANRETTAASITVKYNDAGTRISHDYYTSLTDDPEIAESVVYREEKLYYAGNGSAICYPTLTFDGVSRFYAASDEGSVKRAEKFTIYDCSAGNIVTEAERQFMRKHNLGDLFLAGGEFTGDGKGQVILSSAVTDYFGLVPAEIVGKTLSYTATIGSGMRAYVASETGGKARPVSFDSAVVSIFKDFTVVGVFNENLYLSYSRGESIGTSDFWIASSSLFDTPPFALGGDVNEPYRDYAEDERVGYLYDDDPMILAAEATEEGLMFLPYGMASGVWTSGDRMNEIVDRCQILQYKDFEAAYRHIDVVRHYTELSMGENVGAWNAWNSYTVNSFLNDYEEFYPLIYMAILSFSVVGGVVFFSTVVNLYNTARYSVEKRRRFLAMCRAVGMTKGEVNRLYFAEILLTFLRAAIWVIGVSFVFCLALTIGLDYASAAASTTFLSYRLNFIFYPLTVVCTVLAVAVISLVISSVVCALGARGRIVEELKE